MKSSSRKSWLIAGTLFVLGGVVFGYFIHIRPKQAVARYKAKLVAQGEKLTVEELLPLPVSPAKNSATTYQRALMLLRGAKSLLETNRPEAMRMVAPGRAMVGWQRPHFVDLGGKTLVTNDWAELAAVLAGEQEALTLLHTLIERPTLDWQLNYREGFSMALPHLASTKNSAQHLQAAALLALRDGNQGEAVTNLRAMLALVNSTRDERLIISQLVRMAIANITFAATWSALQSPDLTEGQLAALQRDWTELDFALPMENALAMERGMAEMTIERMRNSSAEFRKVSTGFGGGGGGRTPSSGDSWMEEAGLAVGRGWDAATSKAKESAWRASWSLTDELTALKGHQVMLDTTRAARSNGCYLPAILAQRAQLAQLGITNKPEDDFNLFGNEPDLRTMFSDSLTSLGKTLDKVMTVETTRRFAVVGIALRRSFQRHGRYPAALAALVPEFLPAVPCDPVDGQPLRYRLADTNTFVLYSIGKDGADDGGDVTNPSKSRSLYWQNGRDWVWPQPASEAEIAAYFAAEIKKAGR